MAPKKLLSLDGGGVKGISSLILLQAIMDEVKKQEGGEGDERKPVDYFDLAAGTSTGGLMALMLFRLRMPVSEVIAVYTARAKDIFSPTFLKIPLDKVPLGHWLAFKVLLKVKAFFTGQEFTNDGLKKVIHDVVKKHPQNEEDKKKGSKSRLVHDKNVGDSDHGVGQYNGNMFMCATIRDRGECVLLRSYKQPEDVHYKSSTARFAKRHGYLNDIDIETAALATSAAPLYLPPVTFPIPELPTEAAKPTSPGNKPKKLDPLVFWDGGLLNNNPINELWDARYDLVGEKDPPPAVSFVLSLGCSFADPPKSNAVTIVQRLVAQFGKIASFMTNTEAKNRDFWRYADRVRDRNDMNADLHYLRLNAPTKKQTFDMADWKGMKELSKLTEEYRDEILKDKENDIAKAAALLRKVNPDNSVVFSIENGVPFPKEMMAAT